jgi:hypothetical protein
MAKRDNLTEIFNHLKNGKIRETDISVFRRALQSGQIILATGNRAVAIGGNVNDAIIITGDGNVVKIFKGSDADAIQQIVKAELEKISIDSYSRALQEYFRALRNYCANFPYLTLNNVYPHKTLDDVYVPLRASLQSNKTPLAIKDIMQNRKHSHLIILGEPGAGKSTLLRQLAKSAWDAPSEIGLEKPHLALIAPLRRLNIFEGAIEKRLNHVLASELALLQPLPDGFFQEWSCLMDAPWLLLLDGLDEVSAVDRPAFMQWLNGFIGQSGIVDVIITSRPSGYYQGELNETHFEKYEILSFTRNQSVEFAHKWFGENADAFLDELDRVYSRALNGTPLLMTIAAEVYFKNKALPIYPTELYRQFIDVYLNEARRRDQTNELDKRIWKVAKFGLARLAWTMTVKSDTTAEIELENAAAEYLKEALTFSNDLAETEGKNFVEVMARRSGVFLRHENTYDWIHLTFREYLATVAAVRQNKGDLEKLWQAVIVDWRNKDWREVAIFSLSLANEEHEIVLLLQRIINQDKYEFDNLEFVTDVLLETKVNAQFVDNFIDILFEVAIKRKTSLDSVAYELVKLSPNYSRARAAILALYDGKEWIPGDFILLPWWHDDNSELEPELALELLHFDKASLSVREKAVWSFLHHGDVGKLKFVMLDEQLPARLRLEAAHLLEVEHLFDVAIEPCLSIATNEVLNGHDRAIACLLLLRYAVSDLNSEQLVEIIKTYSEYGDSSAYIGFTQQEVTEHKDEIVRNSAKVAFNRFCERFPDVFPRQKKTNTRNVTKKTTKASQRKEKLVYCPTCNLPFKGKESLTNHIRNWHTEKSASS